MSEARMSHLLAAEHGWIDLVVKAPPPSNGAVPGRECAISFTSNGELLLREGADYSAAAQAGAPVGYRFPVSVGALKVELAFSGCLRDEARLRQDVTIRKDQLVELMAEGSALKLGASSPYVPASLDDVRGKIGSLQDGVRASDARASSLKTLVHAGLALNAVAVVLLLMLWRRRGG